MKKKPFLITKNTYNFPFLKFLPLKLKKNKLTSFFISFFFFLLNPFFFLKILIKLNSMLSFNKFFLTKNNLFFLNRFKYFINYNNTNFIFLKFKNFFLIYNKIFNQENLVQNTNSFNLYNNYLFFFKIDFLKKKIKFENSTIFKFNFYKVFLKLLN